MNIGERVYFRRKQLGLTQTELAEKAGYSGKSSIAKIETGASDVSQSKIISLARALDCTIDYLMGWSDDICEKTPAVDVERQALIDLVMEMSPDQVRSFLNILRNK